ncbi:MAG: hypothetical protein JW820_16455 [Spirochaetales bacterium]|nr:hypothetical protein [Spirochaetales bacterium]
MARDCAQEGIAFELLDTSAAGTSAAGTAVQKAFLKTDSIGRAPGGRGSPPAAWASVVHLGRVGIAHSSPSCEGVLLPSALAFL